MNSTLREAEEQLEHSFKELLFLANNETQMRMVKIARQNAHNLIQRKQLEARIDERMKIEETLGGNLLEIGEATKLLNKFKNAVREVSKERLAELTKDLNETKP